MIDFNEFLIFDGAMGTMLQKSGLKPGELPEYLNLSSPETILNIHREYLDAGSDVITANTFGANRHKIKDSETVTKIIVKRCTKDILELDFNGEIRRFS